MCSHSESNCQLETSQQKNQSHLKQNIMTHLQTAQDKNELKKFAQTSGIWSLDQGTARGIVGYS